VGATHFTIKTLERQRSEEVVLPRQKPVNGQTAKAVGAKPDTSCQGLEKKEGGAGGVTPRPRYVGQAIKKSSDVKPEKGGRTARHK